MKEAEKSVIETAEYRKRLDAVKELFQREYGLRPGEPTDITFSGLIVNIESFRIDHQRLPNVKELRRMLMPGIQSHRRMDVESRRTEWFMKLKKELLAKNKTSDVSR